VASLGTIGKYELLKQLAVGGMAEIYLARQSGPEGFSKLVVIKRILENLAAQERFVQMFLDEARVAARFNHPNIVQIFDLGREEDAFYIAMEYIPGEDIKALVRRCAKRRQRIPIEHVVKIFSGVLDGLHFAHAQKTLDNEQVGVVHRDVSPHNIIVSFQGNAKLLDFGIAKARSEISTTIPGRVKGKHAYMSPEQVHAQELDGRSDIFAAGIVMYELLTWSRLFKRSKHIETLRAVCEAPIRPPRELNPDIDPALESIVLKALARERGQRYQTAQQMQMDLEDYLLQSGKRSNPVLIGQFMQQLFSDKLEAQEKALTQVHAENLESAVLQAEEKESGPDLVAFLDMFFDDGTKGDRTPGSLGRDGSAPEFTPSGEYTPAQLPEQDLLAGGHRSEIPPRARGEYMPRRAPPPKPPDGMDVKHVAPSRQRREARAPAEPAAAEPQPAPIDPLTGDIMDPGAGGAGLDAGTDYAAELDPLGKSSKKGKIIGFLVLLLILGGGGFLLYHFRDQLATDEAPAVGMVEVVSVPGGADVYLDGEHQMARTPMEIDGIEPGVEHELRVSLPGLPAWETQFTLEDTTEPLTIKAILSKEAAEKARMRGEPIIFGIAGEGRGAIQVSSDPPGAQIFLDGVAVGKKTPATLANVAADRDHVILLALEDHAPSFERLHLEADQTAEVKLGLEPGEPPKGRIKVRFETEPEGAEVRINGYPMRSKTPMAAKMLAKGASEVELVHQAGKRSLQVRPVPNVDLTIFVELE
jgi:serine/threonine-protein kinase